MGRICAVLRLGERPNARSPRYPVLVSVRAGCGRRRPRARVRDRTNHAPSLSRRCSHRWNRPIGGDACSRTSPLRSRRAARTDTADTRRHTLPAVCRFDIYGGAGAVRRAAVAAERAGSRGDARSSPSRAEAGRHVRPGTGCRSARVGGVPEAHEPSRMASPRRCPRDACRDSSARSRTASHDLSSGVHRTARTRSADLALCADVPDLIRAADGAAAGKGGVFDHCAAG
jgi:hypothetical protein